MAEVLRKKSKKGDANFSTLDGNSRLNMELSGPGKAAVKSSAKARTGMDHRKRYARKEADMQRLCHPVANEPQMIGQSSQEVESLLKVVQELESVAFRNALSGIGLEILTKTRNFLGLLVELLTLRRAFQLSPRRAIEGSNGVAEILGVTKGTVHDRIKSLGLSVDDMRNQYMGLDELIVTSDPLLGAKAELVRLRNEHLAQEIDSGSGQK